MTNHKIKHPIEEIDKHVKNLKLGGGKMTPRKIYSTSSIKNEDKLSDKYVLLRNKSGLMGGKSILEKQVLDYKCLEPLYLEKTAENTKKNKMGTGSKRKGEISVKDVTIFDDEGSEGKAPIKMTRDNRFGTEKAVRNENNIDEKGSVDEDKREIINPIGGIDESKANSQSKTSFTTYTTTVGEENIKQRQSKIKNYFKSSKITKSSKSKSKLGSKRKQGDLDKSVEKSIRPSTKKKKTLFR